MCFCTILDFPVILHGQFSSVHHNYRIRYNLHHYGKTSSVKWYPSFVLLEVKLQRTKRNNEELQNFYTERPNS
jgi:hypothetical protein